MVNLRVLQTGGLPAAAWLLASAVAPASAQVVPAEVPQAVVTSSEAVDTTVGLSF